MIQMTAAEAEALECNRCGDCCESRSVEREWPDLGQSWRWGTIPDDRYASINDGQPLIIPLLEATPGYYEDAPASVRFRGSMPYRCTQFSRDDDGLGVCGLHDAERPEPCGSFPFKYMDDPEAFAQRVAFFPRCTWYDIEIVDD